MTSSIPLRRGLRARTVIAVLAVAVAVGSCRADGGSSRPPPPTETTSTSSTVPAPTSSTLLPGTTQPTSGCPEGEPMVSDGRLLQSDRPGAGGQTIGGVAWRTRGGCHVITITFTTADGAPATTAPTLVARLMRDAGVVRVETEATSSLLIDQQVESEMVGAMYVPVSESETRFIDLTLLEPVVGRATILSSPARLEIELESGGTPDMGSPLVTEDLVVVEPVAEALDDPIMDISGYAYGPEDDVVFEVVADEAVLESQELTVGGAESAWTGFRTTIQVGDLAYDVLRISDDEGTIAGIPISRSGPEEDAP